MARGIGGHTEGRTLHGHGRIGEMFARTGIDDMSGDIRIARTLPGFGGLFGRTHQVREEHGKCSRKIFFHDWFRFYRF